MKFTGHSVRVVIFTIAAASAFSAIHAGPNPCHPDKEQLGVSCNSITLPNDFCSGCSLRKVQSNGNVEQCDRVYDIDNKECKNEMWHYVRLNPCDYKRREQIEKWDHASLISLDYMVYSVCEQCCDSIPANTVASEYEKRYETNQLYTADRGNAVAHAAYDVCKVFPNIKYFRNEGGNHHPSWPEVCPLLRSWFHSPDSNNWLSNNGVRADGRIKRFIQSMNGKIKCFRKDVWTQCLAMEQAQNRV